MDLGLPADLTWYKLLTDWGSFVGAAIALLAAAVTFLVVNGQTREAATEEAQRRKSARRAEALDVVRAITLVEGALDVFDNDLSHVSNTFDPRSQDEGFLATKIDPERAAWIRSRLTPPIFESLLPYVGRLDPSLAKEYLYLFAIAERIKRQEGATTFGDLRLTLATIRHRSKDLAERLKAERVQAEQLAKRISDSERVANAIKSGWPIWSAVSTSLRHKQSCPIRGWAPNNFRETGHPTAQLAR